MKLTLAQQRKILSGHSGHGWLIFRNGETEIREIEIYFSRDKKIRRVGNGQLLCPIEYVCEGKSETII